MSRRWVVESYNTITEREGRELDEYTNPVAARGRAEALNRRYGSFPGTMYSAVEIDEQGDRVTRECAEPSTGDPELDALIMGDLGEEQH